MILSYSMKVEKCVLQMPQETSESCGSVIIPSGIFELFQKFDAPYKFLAVKKRKSPVLKLIPVEKDVKIFEIYCEVLDNQRIGDLIKFISEFTHQYEELTFLPEIDGICLGKGRQYPCTFDGFATLKGNESLIHTLEKKLKGLVFGEQPILAELSITEVQ